jgi:PTS system nitrogen regulatory IIA component
MYLNLVQLAESFGVPERVVEDWIRREGLPHTPSRGVLLFDRAQVAQWAATRGLAAQAGFLAEGSPALSSNVRIASLLHRGGIWREIDPAQLAAVYVAVAERLPGTTPAVQDQLRRWLSEPGGVTLAPVGKGFALPHPSRRISLGPASGCVALILLRDALVLPGPPVDAAPLKRLFFFIAPSPRTHLDILGRLSRLIALGDLRGVLDRGGSDEEILRSMNAVDETAVSASRGGRAREP